MTTKTDISHLSKLANLPLDEAQAKDLSKQVEITIEYVSKLQDLSTKGVRETSQVIGLENVFREDEIDVNRGLTQDEALANAKRTHNGFFVVKSVFNEQ